MIRMLFRLAVIVVVLVGALVFFGGFRLGDWGSSTPAPVERPLGTTGTGTSAPATDVTRTSAGDRGAEIGRRAGEAVDRAGEALTDSGLTAKIKSKMALDDLVRAAYIDVDTNDGVVTLSGAVASQAERERALQLARETAGVRSVVDKLQER